MPSQPHLFPTMYCSEPPNSGDLAEQRQSDATVIESIRNLQFSTSTGSLIDFEIDDSSLGDSLRAMSTLFDGDDTRRKFHVQSLLLPPLEYPSERNNGNDCSRLDTSTVAGLRLSESSKNTLRQSPFQHTSTSKRSATASQLEQYAQYLEHHPAVALHTPHSSIENQGLCPRPATPSLSYSSTLTSSPRYSSESAHSTMAHEPSSVFHEARMQVMTLNRFKAKPSAVPLGQSSSQLLQRKISGPLLQPKYPSNLQACDSQFHELEPAFKPRRKTPMPPTNSPPLPSSEIPPTLMSQPPPPHPPPLPAERGDFFDWDDDDEEEAAKRPTGPKILKAPSMARLRATRPRAGSAPQPKQATPTQASKEKRGNRATTDSKNSKAVIPEQQSSNSHRVNELRTSQRSSSTPVQPTNDVPATTESPSFPATLKKIHARSKKSGSDGSSTARPLKPKKLRLSLPLVPGLVTWNRPPIGRARAWFRKMFS